MNNTVIYLFAIMLFLTLACSNENTEACYTASADDEETLRYLKEVEWPRAYADQDTVLLDKILGEDFRMIDQSGHWYSKEDEMEWIKKNATNNDSFYFDIKRFEILDNGTALICGTGHILKDSIRSEYQSSNVLVKRNGSWKAVLSHVSGVKNLNE